MYQNCINSLFHFNGVPLSYLRRSYINWIKKWNENETLNGHLTLHWNQWNSIRAHLFFSCDTSNPYIIWCEPQVAHFVMRLRNFMEVVGAFFVISFCFFGNVIESQPPFVYRQPKMYFYIILFRISKQWPFSERIIKTIDAYMQRKQSEKKIIITKNILLIGHSITHH